MIYRVDKEDKVIKMSKVKVLRELVKQRQSAAAEEVLQLFERSCCSSQRQHTPLEAYSLTAGL